MFKMIGAVDKEKKMQSIWVECWEKVTKAV